MHTAFPVHLKLRVEPPPVISARYDVGTVELDLGIDAPVLAAPPLSGPGMCFMFWPNNLQRL